MTAVDASRIQGALRDELRELVAGRGVGDTEVLDVDLDVYVDVAENDALSVTLYLPAPRGATWDVDRTFDLKQSVRRTADELVARHGLVFNGATVVELTSLRAPDDDVADPEPAGNEEDRFGKSPSS